MKKLYIYLILVFISTLTSCVDDITPDFEFDEQVFISGLLTNEPGFVSVQVQKTVPANDDTAIGIVNDAKVSLYTRNTSNIVLLVSDSFTVDNGIYTSTEVITPIVGNTYWIEVVLQDDILIKSEEELLKEAVVIKRMEKNKDVVRTVLEDQKGRQNYYLIRAEKFRDDELIDEYVFVFNDTFVTENLEEFVEIRDVKDGDSLRINVLNINFNTFQFYVNVLNDEDDVALSTLFLPINIVGNITNITTNKVALGNFGIAGTSTMMMTF